MFHKDTGVLKIFFFQAGLVSVLTPIILTQNSLSSRVRSIISCTAAYPQKQSRWLILSVWQLRSPACSGSLSKELKLPLR